ncbi:hypothetical protein ACFX19_045864 [Malus domestica]
MHPINAIMMTRMLNRNSGLESGNPTDQPAHLNFVSSSLSPNSSSSSANKRVREQHHFSSDSHVKVKEGRLEDSVSCRVGRPSQHFYLPSCLSMSSAADPEHKEDDEAPLVGDDEDTGAQVAPIIWLEEVVVITGEEKEDAILDLKAKLYRFDKDGNQWKEQGAGTVKFLKHKKTGQGP